MIREIQARTILSAVKQPDPYFGLRYNMNLYRGCQHQCIYCDSRSQCYGIENFNGEVLVKSNAIELLEQELPRKRHKGTVGTGAMNDPYMPLEARWNLTGRALALLAKHGFGVHIITKGALVLRDLPLLLEIGRVYAAVSFTLTTTDDALAKKLEPGASLPSERLAAMAALSRAGVYTGVTMMPILPFLEDNEENVGAIVQRAAEAGAQYILPWFGMSLRDRQRQHYYAQLDRHFPGLRARYEATYGEQYGCTAPNAQHLGQVYAESCAQQGIATRLRVYAERTPRQLALF